jgi:hypothetical protein
MAYSPLALKPILNGRAGSLITKRSSMTTRSQTRAPARPAPAVAPTDSVTDSAAVAVTPRPATPKLSRPRVRRLSTGLVLTVLGSLALFVAVLPIIAVLGSLPAGLISALIIGIGMRRAWRMTADSGSDAPGTTIVAGPFRVGHAAGAAPA